MNANASIPDALRPVNPPRPMPRSKLSPGDAEYITNLRLRLLANGYLPIPSHDKTSRWKGWNQLEATPEDIAEWLPARSGASRYTATGVLVCRGLTAIDIDLPDEALAREAMRICYALAPQLAGSGDGFPPAPIRGRSGSSKVMLLCRRQQGDPPVFLRTAAYVTGPDDKSHKVVEIYSNEKSEKRGRYPRQLGIDGPHSLNPDGSIKALYEWRAPLGWPAGQEPPGLDTVALRHLPVVDVATMRRMIEAIDAMLLAQPDLVVSEPKHESAGRNYAPSYTLTGNEQFITSEGEHLTYDELLELAKHTNPEQDGEIRVSGGFTGTGTGATLNRCVVHYREDEAGNGFLAIVDFGLQCVHRPVWREDVEGAGRPAALVEDVATMIARSGIAASQLIAAPEPTEVEHAVTAMQASAHSDKDVALYLVAMTLPRLLRYSPARDRWYGFRDGLWEVYTDAMAEYVISNAMGSYLRDFEEAARGEADEDEREERMAQVVKMRNRFGSARALAGIRRALSSIAAVHVDTSDFDYDPWLAGIPGGGAVDLRTGAIRAALPEDMLTKRLHCAPKLGECPQFDDLLERFCQGQPGLRRMIMQMFGAALVGKVLVDKFVYMTGPGGNGKSTLLDVLRHLAGDYGGAVPAKLFMHNQNGRLTPLSLAGMRAGFMSEMPAGGAWDAEALKGVVSGEPVSDRKVYAREEETISPCVTLFFAGNDLPALRFIDRSMPRRMLIVDVQHSVIEGGGEEFGIGRRLVDEEGGAILTQVILGLADFLHSGLVVPASVSEALDEYVAENDRIGNYLRDTFEDSREPADLMSRSRLVEEVKQAINSGSTSGRAVADAIKRSFPQVYARSVGDKAMPVARVSTERRWVGLRRKNRLPNFN